MRPSPTVTISDRTPRLLSQPGSTRNLHSSGGCPAARFSGGVWPRANNLRRAWGAVNRRLSKDSRQSRSSLAGSTTGSCGSGGSLASSRL